MTTNLYELGQWILNNPKEVATIVAFVLTLISAIRERLRVQDIALLLLNVLKDEQKTGTDLADKGGTFKTGLIAKVEKVAEIQKVGASVVDEVKATVAKVNDRNGIKVGSYQGKPIYLDQVGTIGSSLAASLKILRDVIRR